MVYNCIVHIADVHIRTNRIQEYIEVFNKLFKSIKSNIENPLILLCGDIIHNKSKITPEVIKLTNYLLNGLGDLGDVILISGNHDMIEHNNSRDKFLEVIEKHKRIRYINKSDRYIFDNISLAISTLDDRRFISYTEDDTTDVNVAMGHFMYIAGNVCCVRIILNCCV